MYIIKHLPEDFYVKELHTIQPQETGDYAYFVLKKKNYTTLDAAKRIADVLHLRLKHIGYAGSKDKRAITEQTCSAKNIHKEQIEKICLKDIELNYLGRGNTPISLGDHTGNHFKIVVRNISAMPQIKTHFINYFGEQRLSTNNAIIGKLIVQKKFKEATNELSNEPSVANYLQQHTTDYIGALKQLPLKLLKFYIHAYQSLLWNTLAREHSTDEKLPVIGFSTEEISIVKKILAKEGITPRDFIIKQFPELSSEGTERTVIAQAKDLIVGELEEDEFYSGMKKITLSFSLSKGNYATEFLRQYFSDCN